MATIHYTIEFFSEWHAGSGLSSGSDIDTLVIKDPQGYPFIPGKTLKGLLKEAAMEIYGDEFASFYRELPNKAEDEAEDKKQNPSHFISRVFGYFDEKDKEKLKLHEKGQAFFSNATLSEELKKSSQDLQSYFFRAHSSTAIDEKSGLARDQSLRRMETTIPCTLWAAIYNVPDEDVEDLIKCLKWIKRLGTNRNRGLGRCKFTVIPQDETETKNQQP